MPIFFRWSGPCSDDDLLLLNLHREDIVGPQESASKYHQSVLSRLIQRWQTWSLV